MSSSKAMKLKTFSYRVASPSMESKKKCLGMGPPKYTDLQELSQQISMYCDNHLNGDDSTCSRRKSFAFARYLDCVEGGELPMDNVDDEQQQQQQEEEQESVVIDCRDRASDKISFVKHNVQCTIILK
ncbi:hypothetical protein CDAR_23331 [Caerostris darwini]|uniref:Uncharacterized protein n=1 Tax=Caerostris darwini TaxID=1538125 RepID=A0AAV4T7G9_9ARAC|nr:hypothetical protein CDAR_23331 [Caerostris darwini]